ncbi:hypothetical protein ES703_13168 [subsurface metagenome]
MKILIYGAGVLGSFYAAQLHKGGHDVSILARGQRLSDLREHGIVLESATTGERTITRVNVVDNLAPEDAYDLVIVVMRKNQIVSVLPTLAANQHTPNVLFMGNNAAGPNELVEALGPERVLLGFGGVGGLRSGHVIHHLARSDQKTAPVTIGELDGQTTPRLKHIAAAFIKAGVSVRLNPSIDAWLKSHVALVSPLANALYLAGGDNYQLARTRDGIVLSIRAIREGFKVLRAQGVPVTPSAIKTIKWLPEPILVPLVRAVLNTERAEIGLAGHANAARDEMKHLADEFRALTNSTKIKTPAINRLYPYTDPAVPPIPDGSRQIALSWGGVLIGSGLLVGFIIGLILLLT